MKRFISILFSLILCTTALFSQDYNDEDEYDDGYVYEQNGEGDQFLKIDLGANFPLNFGSQLYVGAAASVGYYYFLSNNFAIGGDAILGYNLSVGKKPLVTVPITFGVVYQPYIGKFEFPFMLNVGFATVSCQQLMYFPALAMKASAGAYYRWSETWSFGLSAHAYWIPLWYTNKDYNDNGLFASVDLGVRYHF
jgi:hypothetical protein